MNHRTPHASRRNAAVASAVNPIPVGINHDEIGKLHGTLSANGDHPDDDLRFANQQKHKDYQYDRNTLLIGVVMFVTYALAKSVYLGTTTAGLGYTRNTVPPPLVSSKQLSAPDPIDTNGSIRLQGTIGLPKPPPAVLPPEGFATDNESSTTTTTTTAKNPPHHHLDLQSRNGTLVTLVHIGKSGGSALRDVIDYAVGYCKINYLPRGSGGTLPIAEGSLFLDAHLHDRTTLQKHMCALARITNGKRMSHSKNALVHLDRNLERTWSDPHFLVPIRNPVDRLISWFHYERHWQTVKRTRYSTSLYELIDPSRCNFTTVDELFLGRHGDHNNNDDGGAVVAPPPEPSEAHRRYRAGRPAIATPEYCYQLSRDCLSGAIPCYGHNFFNYEYYLEDILVRVLGGVAAGHGKDNDATTTATTTTNVPRIDVIRAERSWDDLNRTLSEWTGLPMTPDMDFFYLNRKPFEVDTHDQNKTVSPDAARSLCETICPELVAYTKIVKHAANLPPEEKTATFRELDATCGVSVRAVCGKTFRYRRIRAAKESVLCEPRHHPENRDSDEQDVGDDEDGGGTGDASGGDASANATTTVERRRRLAYLSTQDLPSC